MNITNDYDDFCPILKSSPSQWQLVELEGEIPLIEEVPHNQKTETSDLEKS
jgi:hypothetical protein